MAFIHTSGGYVIRVLAGREAITMAIRRAMEGDGLLELEAEGGQSAVKLTLSAGQVAVVTEEPLPRL